MSQSQHAVNFSSSRLLAGTSRNQLVENYLLNAKTVADQPSHFMPRLPNQDEDCTQMQWASRNPSGKSNPALAPSVIFGNSVQGKNTYLRQAMNIGTARVHHAPAVSIQDDPVPTPTPVCMHHETVNSTTESIEVPAKHDVPIHQNFHDDEDLTIDSTDKTLDPYKHDPIAYAETQVKTKPSRYPSKEIEIGSVVAGRYEVLSEISRGGYGIVYRARQIGVDRIVALKRLRRTDDPSINKRFLLEANIIKNLIHPNTIQLIDAGMDEGHLFLVMEYIEGKSLHSLLKEQHVLSQERAIHITKQILKSLNEAHQRGIVHRDMKPSNILLRDIIGETDFVKVLDFGIAKAKNIQIKKLTEQGKIMGTPRYLAPELLFGEEAGPGADIFAIGLILAEMLIGKPVMPSELGAIIKVAASRDPIHIPSSLRKTEIGAIIQKALQKDPRQRYASAEEMLYDLTRLETKPIEQYSPINKPKRRQSLTKQPRISSFKLSKLAIAAMFLFLTNAFLIYRFLL